MSSLSRPRQLTGTGEQLHAPVAFSRGEAQAEYEARHHSDAGQGDTPPLYKSLDPQAYQLHILHYTPSHSMPPLFDLLGTLPPFLTLRVQSRAQPPGRFAPHMCATLVPGGASLALAV